MKEAAQHDTRPAVAAVRRRGLPHRHAHHAHTQQHRQDGPYGSRFIVAMFATAMVTLAPTKRGDSSRDGCHPAADGDGAQVRGGACVARACASLFIAVCVCLARQRPLPPPSPPCHRHHRGVVPNLPRGCRCRGRRPCRLDRAGRCVVHVAMSGMWCCRLTPFCCRRGRLPSVLCRRVLVAPCCCCRASSRRLLLHTPPPQCMLALTTSWSVLLRAPCVRVCTRGGVLRDCLCRWPCACRAAPTVPAGSVRAGALALKCGMIPDWNKWGVRYPLTVLKVRVTSTVHPLLCSALAYW
jgi:hypothetical protein